MNEINNPIVYMQRANADFPGNKQWHSANGSLLAFILVIKQSNTLVGL